MKPISIIFILFVTFSISFARIRWEKYDISHGALGRLVSQDQPVVTERTDRMIEPNHPQDTAEFRQRVLEGLGQPKAERLAPAVRRYAEELLK